MLRWTYVFSIGSAIVASRGSEAYLYLFYYSGKLGDTYLPNWNNTTLKAAVIGLIVGFCLGLWIDYRRTARE